MFEISNFDEKHELFSNTNKRVNGIFKMEKTKNIWIDEFVCLKSKMNSFKFGGDFKIELKGTFISQKSKQIKFEVYKNCLDGEDYQRQCNIYIVCSINHE